MWTNDQRDGRPAKYICSTSQFGWHPLLQCRAVTLPRRETRWNLQGCPKLANRSELLVSRKFTTLWEHVGRISLFNKFFPIVDKCLSCKDIVRQSCVMVPRWAIFGNFLGPAFPASRVQHISDLHSKFALGSHHVSKYGRHRICDRTTEIRRGKKEDETKQKYNVRICYAGRP